MKSESRNSLLVTYEDAYDTLINQDIRTSISLGALPSETGHSNRKRYRSQCLLCTAKALVAREYKSHLNPFHFQTL